MDKIKVFREYKDNSNIFGCIVLERTKEQFDIKKVSETSHVLYTCISVENAQKAIPTGTYEIVLYKSPKFKIDVLLLKNVPNRSFIEIHPANKANQLEGCIAPNTYLDFENKKGVNSRTAFQYLMKFAKDIIEVKKKRLFIEIIDNFL